MPEYTGIPINDEVRTVIEDRGYSVEDKTPYYTGGNTEFHTRVWIGKGPSEGQVIKQQYFAPEPCGPNPEVEPSILLENIWRREQIILMKIGNHPSIPLLEGAFKVPEFGYFIIQEQLPGRTLVRYLNNHEISVSDTALTVLSAARTAEYFHREGVVHSDLVARNILREEQASIVDFGMGGMNSDFNRRKLRNTFTRSERKTMGPRSPYDDILSLSNIVMIGIFSAAGNGVQYDDLFGSSDFMASGGADVRETLDKVRSGRFKARPKDMGEFITLLEDTLPAIEGIDSWIVKNKLSE